MFNVKVFVSMFTIGILTPLFSISIPIIIDDSNIISASSNFLGPFIEGVDSEITFTFKSKKSVNMQIFVGYGIRYGQYPTSYTKASSYYVANNTYSISFNLPGNCIKKSGSYGVIKFLNPEDLSSYATYEFNFYASSYKTININDYYSTNYISNNLSFKFSTSNIIYEHDEFNFKDFQNYIDVDSYYVLDLSRSSIFFNKKLTSYAKIAELTYLDKNNVFPNLKKNDDGLIHIPLSISYLSNKLTFATKNKYYCNPITLDLSSTLLAGYKLTDYFYFPVNKHELLNGTSFNLNVVEFGRDKVSFSCDLLFDVTQLKYGTCQNSDYCIKGGIVK